MAGVSACSLHSIKHKVRVQLAEGEGEGEYSVWSKAYAAAEVKEIEGASMRGRAVRGALDFILYALHGQTEVLGARGGGGEAAAGPGCECGLQRGRPLCSPCPVPPKLGAACDAAASRHVAAGRLLEHFILHTLYVLADSLSKLERGPSSRSKAARSRVRRVDFSTAVTVAARRSEERSASSPK